MPDLFGRLTAWWADTRTLRRFQREMRALGRLTKGRRR